MDALDVMEQGRASLDRELVLKDDSFRDVLRVWVAELDWLFL